MERICMLRERAIAPSVCYDRFYLSFFRRCRENGYLKTVAARYGDAYAYALGTIEPIIEDGELIVGTSPEPLNEWERQEYQQLLESEAEVLFCIPAGQDSHMAIDYPLLLREGIDGVLSRIEKKIEQTSDAEKLDYYNTCICCLKAVEAYSRRYADCAERLAIACSDKQRKAELEQIAQICRTVPQKPAATFYEAVQSVHFLTHCLSFDPSRRCYQQFQLGHPDRYLYPFYCADIESGRITQSDAQLLLNCLGIQINRRVPRGLSSGYMVGGRDETGNIVQNELTLMCMQVIEDIRLVYPAVGLCYTRGMDDHCLQKACEILSKGCSHPAIFNDDVITEGLMGYGVPEEQAHNYIHSTCVEITPVASSNVWVASPYTNMPQILLDAMQENCPTYDDLWQTVLKKLADSIEANYNQYNAARKRVAQKNINPVLSCFVHDCIDAGTDINQGGATYNWIMPSFVGVANLVDSLYAVKKAVYEDKMLSMQQMNQMLQNNFAGKEDLRQYLLNKLPKYGNDIDEVDCVFSDVVAFLVKTCEQYTPVLQNARIIPSVFCWVVHELFGSKTGATPDGRLAGFPLGDGSGACQGRERNGPLASLISSTKWSHKEMIGGVAVNLKFSRKIFSKDSFRTMVALVKTYLQQGGFELQINVIDRKTLQDAVEHPENYRDLIVRIGGYSDYFIHLSPNMQREVILRTEHEI